MLLPSPRIPRLLIAAILVAGLGSCATKSASERRVRKNPELYEKLSSGERSRVERGEIAEGMSPDAVFLAWGRPDMVRSGRRDGTDLETWAYFGHSPTIRPSIGFGAGRSRRFYNRFGVHPTFGYGSGAGWNYGAGMDLTRHVVREVEFRDDRVVGWEQRH